MTRQVNLSDVTDWERIQVSQRAGMSVDTTNVDVIDVQQQRAAGTAYHLRNEVRFCESALCEREVGGRILQCDGPPECVLDMINMFGHATQCFDRIWHWQEVVEETRVMRRPCQVLGYQYRLVPFDDGNETCQVSLVERTGATERQADPVDGKRVLGADSRELTMRYASRTHVVFGVDLEKAELARRRENLAHVLGL
ncbi:hypothetical protein BJI69_19915 [Luteibacter rhizovicinus DSM 16549]|uniref:Uncharacterized protein n=1 Tax=Luteibacter rhizovicinus DSM 16549 TaxID=1440763 RepID=A0A0G9HC84_9GAMM|nr:hypothetical protein BJI69_19915 [Luteibacter rhizovicinus DSM 16549]KLD67106.1 hypothetical protein Y883_09070 [Luteibacter rhizovicinus DSM 16549]